MLWNRLWGNELGKSGPVAHSWEHDGESSGSINDDEVIHNLRNSLFQTVTQLQVDGSLWSAATNGPSVHYTDDIWVWRVTV
jgi:hypothetical protein